MIKIPKGLVILEAGMLVYEIYSLEIFDKTIFGAPIYKKTSHRLNVYSINKSTIDLSNAIKVAEYVNFDFDVIKRICEERLTVYAKSSTTLPTYHSIYCLNEHDAITFKLKDLV